MKTEDIKKMAQAWKEVQEAAYGKKSKNEELKGNQHKLDHNKDGKISSADFKGLRKKAKKDREVEVQTSEAKIDEISKKTLGSYIKKAAGGDKNSLAHSMKDMMTATRDGDKKTYKKSQRTVNNRSIGMQRAADRLTKEATEELDEKVYASDYNVGHEKSQFGGYRPHVTHKKTGKTMYLGQTSYKKPEHAKGHAAAYLKGYEQMGDRTASRMGNEYEKSNKKHVYKESVEEAANHGNMNNGSPAGEGLSPSAKDQLAKKTPAPSDAFDAEMVNKKTFDAMRASAKKAPMRNNDNVQGDKTPPKGK